jgi:general secretion pathway protein D
VLRDQRRATAALLLPALAHAAADDAALNFVGADIESVIKAVGHYTNITFVIDPRVKGTLTWCRKSRSPSRRLSAC